MKNVIQATIAILLFTATAVAASGNAQEKYQPEKGDQALQFQIDASSRSPLGHLSDYAGATLSYKRLISDRRALQLGLRLAGGLETSSDADEYPHADSLDFESSGDGSDLSVELSLLLVNTLPGDHTWFYYGYGPAVSYSKYNNEHECNRNTEPPEFHLHDMSMVEFEAGLTAVAGVEWGLTDYLTIHAEYRSSFMYMFRVVDQTSSSEDPESYEEHHDEDSRFSFLPDGVRFGLSIYF